MTRRSVRSATIPSVVGGFLLFGAWLVIGALPVLADGGPHVASANSGTSTLAADTCAGCHRAHAAAGPSLLTSGTDQDLCFSCHGAIATGATTDVVDGNQYAHGATAERGVTIAGALRGGGFVNARIDSTHIQRISYPRITGQSTVSFSSLVPALTTPAAVTSAHLAVSGSSITAKGVAWGNGATNTGAGPSVTMGCTSCHNPHGNGYYRILNPVPAPDGSGFVAVTSNATVTDAALPAGAGNVGTRNYTIIWGRTLADVVNGTYPGGGTSPNGGDYWRKYLP
jgi:predicted CXXCH cytochrome family protein